jgi:hypothetical protein
MGPTSRTGATPAAAMEVGPGRGHLRSWLGRLRSAGGLGIALPPFAASKAIALLVPMLTVWARSTGVGVPPAGAFLRPFDLWDGAAYLQIATGGYPAGPVDLSLGGTGHLWAYFPGYPLLVHLAGFVVPQTIAAAIVVSAAGELVALVFLARLVLLERPGDEGAARFACWTLAVFPYAFYLTSAYTESAFLAGAVTCLYWMRRGREGRAGLAAAAASLLHVTGVALVPAMAVNHLVRRRGRPGPGLLWSLGGMVGPVLFGLYAWSLTGDPLTPVHVEQSASFNRMLDWPWAGALATGRAFTGGVGVNSFVFGMEILFGAGSLEAVVWLAWHWRTIPPAFTVYAVGVWVMMTSVIYWLSTPRYEMTAVPLYLAGADLTRRHPRARPVVVAVSAGWMGFLCTLAATGQFVA